MGIINFLLSKPQKESKPKFKKGDLRITEIYEGFYIEEYDPIYEKYNIDPWDITHDKPFNSLDDAKKALSEERRKRNFKPIHYYL